jgi:hypothetical protein
VRRELVELAGVKPLEELVLEPQARAVAFLCQRELAIVAVLPQVPPGHIEEDALH